MAVRWVVGCAVVDKISTNVACSCDRSVVAELLAFNWLSFPKFLQDRLHCESLKPLIDANRLVMIRIQSAIKDFEINYTSLLSLIPLL